MIKCSTISLNILYTVQYVTKLYVTYSFALASYVTYCTTKSAKTFLTVYRMVQGLHGPSQSCSLAYKSNHWNINQILQRNASTVVIYGFLGYSLNFLNLIQKEDLPALFQEL